MSTGNERGLGGLAQLAGWTPERLGQMINANSENVELAQRAQHTAYEWAQQLMLEQSAAMRETFYQLMGLYGAWNDKGERPDMTDAQRKCARILMGRALEHYQIALSHARDLHDKSCELAKDTIERTTAR